MFTTHRDPVTKVLHYYHSFILTERVVVGPGGLLGEPTHKTVEIEFLPIVDEKGNFVTYEYILEGYVFTEDGTTLHARQENGSSIRYYTRTGITEDISKRKPLVMSPKDEPVGTKFKPPPDWASARPFVPSELRGCSPKPASEWVKAKEFIPAKEFARFLPVGGSVIELNRIPESIPREVQNGSSGSRHFSENNRFRPLSALMTSDLNKIKEFVPRKFQHNFGDISKIPEFVPRTESPANLIGLEASTSGELTAAQQQGAAEEAGASDGAAGYVEGICPYFLNGSCRFGDGCSFIHGNVCEYCNFYVLHPYDKEQNDTHYRECLEEHERDMELSFAVAHSTGRQCAICYEIVMEKQPPGQQRFGILPACNHCFCLSCIRRWRQARQFENKVMRGCPVCRTQSDFVVPNRLWVDSKEEKERLITNYKGAVGKKPCRYFKHGTALCPFGNKCFYLHALQNGTLVDVGPPRRRRRPQADAAQFDPLADSDAESWLGLDDFLFMFAESDDDQSEFETFSDDDYEDIDSP